MGSRNIFRKWMLLFPDSTPMRSTVLQAGSVDLPCQSMEVSCFLLLLFCVKLQRRRKKSSKEEYEPWKWGPTARYYASQTKIMLSTRESCQDQAGNRTKRRLPDHREETQTEVVWWTCLPFMRSGQSHFARHSEVGNTTRQIEKEARRQH